MFSCTSFSLFLWVRAPLTHPRAFPSPKDRGGRDPSASSGFPDFPLCTRRDYNQAVKAHDLAYLHGVGGASCLQQGSHVAQVSRTDHPRRRTLSTLTPRVLGPSLMKSKLLPKDADYEYREHDLEF